MGKTKKQFIEELIQTAQDAVWKNELVIKYREAYPSEDQKKDTVDIKACQHSIEKDLEYIAFLQKQIDENSI